MKSLLRYALFMSVFLLGTAAARADDAGVRVHFVNPGFAEGGFWQTVTDSMQAAADQLGLEMTASHSDREWPRMRDNALRAIAEPGDIDYLILVNEHQQAADLLIQADAAGINTLMLLNSLTPEQEAAAGSPREGLPHWLGSLTPDNARAGREMAEAILSEARGRDPDKTEFDLLTLAGDFATPASLYRLQGLDEVLADNPAVVERRRLTVNWSEQEARQRVDTWLRAGGSFDLIWAANDPIALGAMAAAAEHGLQAGRDYSIAGLNWSAAALERVQAGELVMTHGGHFLAGSWSMILLYDHHHGADFAADASPHVAFPMAPVTRDSSDRLFELLGSESWDRLDYRSFSRHLNPTLADYDFTLSAIEAAIRAETE